MKLKYNHWWMVCLGIYALASAVITIEYLDTSVDLLRANDRLAKQDQTLVLQERKYMTLKEKYAKLERACSAVVMPK